MELWIEGLLRSISDEDAAKLECPITDGPRKGEKVIGTISGRARILRIEASRIGKLASEKSAAHKALHRQGKIHAEEECEKHHRELERLETEFDLMQSLFWEEARRAIPEAAAAEYGIGVRKDWQIVALPKEEESPLSALRGSGFILVGGDVLGKG